MRRFVNSRRAKVLKVLGALAGRQRSLQAVPPRPRRTWDESQLWTSASRCSSRRQRSSRTGCGAFLPARSGRCSALGKKFFIYPDASKNQIYVGGPKEYEAYVQLHPESKSGTQDAANKASAYRGKQDAATRAATARDLSDPFLGASSADLGW